jgi:hypothetical protein
LYIKGNPLQLGYNNGALTQNLMQKQEEIFFSKVKDLFLRSLSKIYERFSEMVQPENVSERK